MPKQSVQTSRARLSWSRLARVGGAWVVAASLTGCANERAPSPNPESSPTIEAETGAEDDLTSRPAPSIDWTRDLLSTDLAVDVSAKTATATVVLRGSASRGASFEAAGLSVTAVTGPKGPLRFRQVEGRLDVGVPRTATDSSLPLTITYAYETRPKGALEGQLPSGTTFVWPYFCGNLFPCKSDPRDGLTFSLALTGIPQGKRAIFPATIPSDAPSYQIAWAIGDYTSTTLGTTPAGTRVTLHTLPGDETPAAIGTVNLVAAFAFYEDTLGPYAFGDEVGSVSVEWGPSGYGGLEHHPYWHIGRPSIGDAETHFHEAAHGFFGDGVRIACWEDFVLSEGTVSYLTARATEVVVGKAAAEGLWQTYQAQLDSVYRSASSDSVAWPQSCGTVDVLRDGLFSLSPYMKGAFFYRAVAAEVGAETLDQVLGSFYRAHVGQAATMQNMLDHIHESTGFDPEPLAEVWLKKLGHP
jgi:hypothetical protein